MNRLQHAVEICCAPKRTLVRSKISNGAQQKMKWCAAKHQMVQPSMGPHGRTLFAKSGLIAKSRQPQHSNPLNLGRSLAASPFGVNSREKRIVVVRFGHRMCSTCRTSLREATRHFRHSRNNVLRLKQCNFLAESPSTRTGHAPLHPRRTTGRVPHPPPKSS